MSLIENTSNHSEAGTVRNGDLVKLKVGWSGPGIVQEVMEQHPRLSESKFEWFRERLRRTHLRVFWTDLQDSEIVPLDNVRVME
jgi:hypothetical protein